MLNFKNIIIGCFVIFAMVSCTKTETLPSNSQTIIANDTSSFTGKLLVRVFDFSTSQAVMGADVFIYANYEDIKKNLYLNTVKTNSNGNADFGFLLTGNYYLRATNNVKADTAAAQIISKNTVTKNMFLK